MCVSPYVLFDVVSVAIFIVAVSLGHFCFTRVLVSVCYMCNRACRLFYMIYAPFVHKLYCILFVQRCPSALFLIPLAVYQCTYVFLLLVFIGRT